MASWDRQAWIVAILGGTLATVFGGLVLYFLLPLQKPDQADGQLYCTASKACIRRSGDRWVLVDAPCPTGQSIRFTAFDSSGCHSLTPTGFSQPLSVCAAICAK
jgi:hypothetical protein